MQATTDDSTSLHDALVLLGDWQNELEWLVVPTAPPSEKSSHHSQRKTQGSTEYRRRREARNMELEKLQTQVSHLEHLLAMEQTRIVQRLISSDTSPVVQESKEVAWRQKHQRVAAETQNQQLRDFLVAHHEIAQRIKKLMRKAMTLTEIELEYRVDSSDRKTSLSTYSGPIISIPQHILYLEDRMDETRMILSSDVFRESSGNDFQRVSVRNLGRAGLQVEVTASWMVPFRAEIVARVLWSQLTHSGHYRRSTDAQSVHETSDLLCTTFVSEPISHHELTCNHGQAISGTTHGITAVRNYGIASDGSRIFLAHIAASILDEDECPKGELHGDGWFQVEPVATTGSIATPYAARIKMCRRVTGRPRIFDSMDRQEQAEWVHSVVVGPMPKYWENGLSCTIQDFENRLLHTKFVSSAA